MRRELRSEAEGDVLGFLHALMMQINEHMTFDEDPTNSGTSAVEAFALKRGVCQDYAHIFIACARSGGVPARFVAGHFLRSDGMVNQQAGHAWAEAFVPDLGWVGFDPANAICTTDAHARVAIGLDYLGAAPVRGTRYGGGMETLSVAVKVDQAGRPRASRKASRNRECLIPRSRAAVVSKAVCSSRMVRDAANDALLARRDTLNTRIRGNSTPRTPAPSLRACEISCARHGTRDIA